MTSREAMAAKVITRSVMTTQLKKPRRLKKPWIDEDRGFPNLLGKRSG